MFGGRVHVSWSSVGEQVSMYWNLLLVVVVVTRDTCTGDGVPACDSQIWCDGPLLNAVQMAEPRLFNDSKTFVDMNLNTEPGTVLSEFQKLQDANNVTHDTIKAFVETYFEGPGGEFVDWTPTDIVDSPQFLEKITNPELKRFGKELCNIWTHLGRKIHENVKKYPDRYSLIYLPHPFIVPGGRFREIYYWDSYWAIRGLLLCGMNSTVKGMLDNLVSFVKSYGHVPNGGRHYYTRRSQPPLLTPMVDMYVTATGDTRFLRENIGYLQDEHAFWLQNRSVDVPGSNNNSHTLNRYASVISKARPESYREDKLTAKGLPGVSAEEMYSELASAAESGWDFSSRWLAPGDGEPFSLNMTRTRDVVPADLNAFLCWNEMLLAKFYRQLGNVSQAKLFDTMHETRSASIEELMWSEQRGSWFDYLLGGGGQHDQFFPSNIAPLFVGCVASGRADKEVKVLNYLKSEAVLDYVSGVPASRVNTGQQWDFPNGWPPLVHMFITALADGGLAESRETAFNIAQKWVKSNWLGWHRTKHMFEKYIVTAAGSRGSGGEYDVQEGFGWSNGVVLDLLDRYGDRLQLDSCLYTTCAASGLFSLYTVLQMLVASLGLLCFTTWL